MNNSKTTGRLSTAEHGHITALRADNHDSVRFTEDTDAWEYRQGSEDAWDVSRVPQLCNAVAGFVGEHSAVSALWVEYGDGTSEIYPAGQWPVIRVRPRVDG